MSNSPVQSTALNQPFEIHSGIHSLVDQFDVFLCDLWGVIHDGQQAYDDVLSTLRKLQDLGKVIIFISNVPRPCEDATTVVNGVGIPSDAYTHLVTSADAARHALTVRNDAFHASLGERFYHLGGGRYTGTLDGLPYTEVSDWKDADFLLNCGANVGEEPEDFRALFTEMAAHDIPMIGVNPDRKVMHGTSIEYCAGSFCALYAELGGRIVEHGKPHPVIYELAKSLHTEIPSERIVMIGDTIHTDIDGAHATGLSAALVTHGIHAKDLDLPLGGAVMPNAEKLVTLFEAEGSVPEFVLPAFIWSTDT